MLAQRGAAAGTAQLQVAEQFDLPKYRAYYGLFGGY